ncbi:MAG: hypothetical protein ACYCW6_11710 [Candidatus Xenobia bacterium]
MIRFVEPLVLRRPGMPFARLSEDVWARLDDPQFVDCLATMHPAALRSLHKRSPRAARTLYRYLARFCARNDSTGTAGVTIWGRLTDGPTTVHPGSTLRRVVWPVPGREVSPELCQQLSQASGRAFAELAPDRHDWVCDAAPLDGHLLLNPSTVPDLGPWFRLAAWHQWQRERHADDRLGEDRAHWDVHEDGDVLHLTERPVHDEFEAWFQGKRFVSTLDLMFDRHGGVLIAEAHSGGEGLPEPTLFPRAHDASIFKGHAGDVFGPNLVIVRPSPITPRIDDILTQLQDATIVDHPGQVDANSNLLMEATARGSVRNVGYSPLALARWASFMAGHGRNETTPEVRLGDLILARRALTIVAPLALQLLEQGALPLPRYTYVSTRGKPMLVDLERDLAREALAADLQRAEHAVFTPMQPALADLWIPGYTSEVRIVTVYQPAES